MTSARRAAAVVASVAALAVSAAASDREPAASESGVPPAAAVTPAPLVQADPAAGVVLDRLDWTGAPAGAEVVVVENDYGDIHVRGTEGDDVVDVHTVVQRLDSAAEKLALAVERVGAAISIRVEYPPLATPDPDVRAKRERLDRGDIVVFVPEAVRLELRTRKGTIDVTEFEGEDVEAETESGAIRVVSEKSVRARSTSGPIHVLLREPDGKKSMWLESESGSIEAELPPGADLDVRAVSGGTIDLAYPTKVVSKDGRNRASFELGAGGRSLVVQSKTGAIRIAPAPAWKPEPGTKRERERDDDD